MLCPSNVEEPLLGTNPNLLTIKNHNNNGAVEGERREKCWKNMTIYRKCEGDGVR